MFKQIRKNFLFIIVSLIVLTVSVMTMLLPAKDYSDTYDEPLSPVPEWSVESFLDGVLLEKYEQYLNDQIWLRDDLLRVKSFFEFLFLRTESHGVATGRDNFMFNRFYSFSPETLRANLDAIDLFAYNTMSETSVMIVPSASYPLVDYLPVNMPLIDQSYYINEINTYLSNTTTPINVKDILAINADKYIYYRTDPNWTTYGAWLAYGQLTAALNLTTFKYDSVPTVKVRNYYGSNYSRSKAFTAQPDTIDYFDFPAEMSAYQNDAQDVIVYDSLYDYAAFETTDKYSAFLNGIQHYSVIKSEQGSAKKGTITVLCDSFGYSFIPFLTQNYNEIIMIDLRYYNGSFDDIRNTRYDDLLILLGFETLCSETAIANLR